MGDLKGKKCIIIREHTYHSPLHCVNSGDLSTSPTPNPSTAEACGGGSHCQVHYTVLHYVDVECLTFEVSCLLFVVLFIVIDRVGRGRECLVKMN